jgi:peptide-methionine (R)-S-oxide reductase
MKSIYYAFSTACALPWKGRKLRYILNMTQNKKIFASSAELNLSEEEWRQRLSPEQYRVMRCEGTECAGLSPLNDEKRAGMFHCAACDAELFASGTKFESGTGWPSFYAPLPGSVGTKRDMKFGMIRTEFHCARCGGHLGHVFEDGPHPTGLRYCTNGVALRFIPE